MTRKSSEMDAATLCLRGQIRGQRKWIQILAGGQPSQGASLTGLSLWEAEIGGVPLCTPESGAKSNRWRKLSLTYSVQLETMREWKGFWMWFCFEQVWLMPGSHGRPLPLQTRSDATVAAVRAPLQIGVSGIFIHEKTFRLVVRTTKFGRFSVLSYPTKVRDDSCYTT